MAKQIPLNKILAAMDRKDRDFYDNLDDDEKKDSYDYIWFLNLFMVGQLLNVLSHQVKEYVVRNILVNQSKFQFQVAFT